MNFQNNGDYPPSFPNLQPSEGLEPFGYPDAAAQELPTGMINPWAELPQYYWGGTLVDPPVWLEVAPSYPYIPQVSRPPQLQPPQSPRLPPAQFWPNPDQQMVSPPRL